jgi:hypothetical protein
MALALALGLGLSAAPAGCHKEPGGPGNVDECSGNAFTPIPPAEGGPLRDPAATPAQAAAIDHVTAFRLAAGALPINLDPNIDVASSAHAAYFVNNPQAYAFGLSPHEEDPAYPMGYTGINFWDRLAAAGYGGAPAYEVMHFIDDPVPAIDSWLNSVYHRAPFVSPAMIDLGYGGASGAGGAADVVDFGCCRGGVSLDTTILYPYHDQADVPAAFDGAEGPAPPEPAGGWPSGPIVSISFHPQADWSISAHEIYDESCTPLAHLASAGPDADPRFEQCFLGGIFLMYPVQPLAPGATYTVDVAGALEGAPFVRTWRFRTAE